MPVTPPNTAKDIDLDELRRQIETLRHVRPVAHVWETLAARFDCSPRTIQRRAIGNGLWEPTYKRREITPEQWLGMLRLNTLNPGMPMNWIAESVGLPYPVAVDHFRRAPGQVTPEWLPVWQAIRRNDALYALHRELAPMPTHASEWERAA